MSDPRWERVKELVDEALRLPPAERAAFLERACLGDAELLTEVRELVRAAENARSSFLMPPELAAPSAQGPAPRTLGDFELGRELGRGGMGVVYEARQRSLQRTVALKVLRIGVTTAQRQVDRFQREPLAVAKLNHPGIVPVFTTGSTADEHYFAMEYVPGGDLGEELTRQRRKEPGRLSAPGSAEHVRSAAQAVAELADALHYAHEHAIVHRDVKPKNILIGEGGHLRLVDFGLARDESLGELTLTGEVAGTPHYMSPEQARAKRNAIDHRTDVYSLGVVLYEMLTLQRPFEGDSAEEVLSQILSKDPLPLRRRNPRIPRDLAVVCDTAMAREPRDRYPTAAALAADLRRFLRFESIEARPPGLGRRTQTFVRRHALALTGGVLLVIGVGLGSSWNAYAGERHERNSVLNHLELLDRIADWRDVEDDLLRDARQALTTLKPQDGGELARAERMARRFGELHDAWLGVCATDRELRGPA